MYIYYYFCSRTVDYISVVYDNVFEITIIIFLTRVIELLNNYSEK